MLARETLVYLASEQRRMLQAAGCALSEAYMESETLRWYLVQLHGPALGMHGAIPRSVLNQISSEQFVSDTHSSLLLGVLQKCLGSLPT